MVGHTKIQCGNHYAQLVIEAKEKYKHGRYTDFLSKMYGDWIFVSALTFLEEMVDGCPAHVLPVYQPPSTFPYLAAINKPILSLYGEFEDWVIKSGQKDLALLKAKATGCPAFQTAIIKGANHSYENREQVLANTLLKWLKSL